MLVITLVPSERGIHSLSEHARGRMLMIVNYNQQPHWLQWVLVSIVTKKSQSFIWWTDTFFLWPITNHSQCIFMDIFLRYRITGCCYLPRWSGSNWFRNHYMQSKWTLVTCSKLLSATDTSNRMWWIAHHCKWNNLENLECNWFSSSNPVQCRFRTKRPDDNWMSTIRQLVPDFHNLSTKILSNQSKHLFHNKTTAKEERHKTTDHLWRWLPKWSSFARAMQQCRRMVKPNVLFLWKEKQRKCVWWFIFLFLSYNQSQWRCWNNSSTRMPPMQ